MRNASLITVGMLTFMSALADASDTAGPTVGQKATYACVGAFGGTYVYTVKSVQDGTVEYDFAAPNHNHRTIVMPTWALGTSLYNKDYGEGYGRGEMTSGLDKFQSLKDLNVGSELSGSVREKASGSPDRTWNYVIKVAERKTVHNDVLGDVEVVVLQEHRSAGGLSSDREAHVVPSVFELVMSHYSDSSGKKRDCTLKAWKRD